MEYKISNDFLELITESTNTTSPVYREAAEAVDKGNNKGMAYLANFMNSIEKLGDKKQVQDLRIIQSKGNIKSFSGYDDIKNAIKFLNKNLAGIADVKNCVTVFDALENWASLYEDGYKNNIRLIELEYENAIFMLVTSLSTILATNMDVVANGTEIKFIKKTAATHGVIQKTMADLAKQLGDRNHKDYLEGLIKASEETITESVYTEANLAAAIGVANVAHATLTLIGSIFSHGAALFKSGTKMVKMITKSVFGIVPLIRSIMYLRYKKKADTIIALEEQMVFVERNIEQLQNVKTMDPKKKEVIIKKQQAVIEQYKKKTEKLRAQLMETEEEATVAINNDNPSLKDTSGELVLESAIFMGKAITPKQKNFMKTNHKLPEKEIKAVRMDKMVEKLGISAPKKTDEPVDQDKIKKAFELFKKNTAKDSIRLVPGKGYDKEQYPIEKTVKMTKIGGVPYWPTNEEWPMDGKTPYICLAQLNLSEMPNLSGYPTTGLLQFFVNGPTEYPAKWEVFYRKNTNADFLTEVPRSTLDDKFDNYPTIDKVYYPTATKEKQIMTPADNNFDIEMEKALGSVFGEKYNYKTNPIPKAIENAFWDQLKGVDYYGCRFGGNPFFTQGDVRDDKYSEMLIQLDSEAGMMWGDVGVANFFISKSKLNAKNFDDVFFTWDCC